MVTLLNDDRVEVELHFGTFHDPLLHCVLCDEAEHAHLLLLTNPVGSVLRDTEKWTNQDSDDSHTHFKYGSCL